MTRPNITPGPWNADISTLKQYTSPRVLKGLREVAIIPTNGSNSLPWREAEANARAIAAVPALLELAEACQRDADQLSKAELRTMIHHLSRSALIAAGYQF